MCIPPTATPLILQILQQYHDSSLARHYGVARTQALVAQYYVSPGMATVVDTYVRGCDSCACNKVVRQSNKWLPRAIKNVVAYLVHVVFQLAAPKLGVEDRIDLNLLHTVHLEEGPRFGLGKDLPRETPGG